MQNVISFWTWYQRQTPTLVPFSCLNQGSALLIRPKSTRFCKMWSRFGLDTNTNANSSTILVFDIKVARYSFGLNRRDCAKCDLVLDLIPKTNANSSTIIVFDIKVARYWYWPKSTQFCKKWSRFGLDTKTNANSSTILVFESRLRAIHLA